MSSFSHFPRRRQGTPTPLAPTDHYNLRRLRSQERSACQDDQNQLAQPTSAMPPVPSVDSIARTDSLLAVFSDLKRRAGRSPGPDGLHYDDLGRSEAAAVLRGLGQAIRNGTYRPYPSRPVQIPKTNGKGYRELHLRNLCDRVVASALERALAPFWSQLFLPGSMGFRPGRGVWRMLAALEHTVVTQNRWVIATDDVRNAFDSVVLNDVLDDHRRHLNDEKLLALVEAILRGHEGNERQVGIDQGWPYSPTALNVRLHHAHDLPFSMEGSNPPWYRYADNLVYVCQDVSEGCQALEEVRRLLEVARLSLKGTDGEPADLRQEGEVQLLGFTLHGRNVKHRLAFDLGKEARAGLIQALEWSHETDNPPETARRAVLGWVSYQGPAFEGWQSNMTEEVQKVLDTAASYGFREIADPGELQKQWQTSYHRWCTFREKMYQREEV